MENKEFPKYVNFHPGTEADESLRAWQGCPTVAVTRGGRLFAGFYTGGLFEPCIYNFNVLMQSDDGGKSWTKPILTVLTDEEKRIRNIDIQLWVTEDNHLWVMWTRSPYYETSVPASIKNQQPLDYHKEIYDTEMMECIDPDADVLVWEKPKIICKGFMRNKPVKLSTGRIIAPAYGLSDPQYMLRYSDDGGKSFYDVNTGVEKPDINVWDETMVWEARERLSMLSRTKQGYYLYSESFDEGKSWEKGREYEPATSSRFYMGVLRDGTVAYVRNVSDTERTGMKLCLSTDGGESFPYELILDERVQVSYPDLDEDADGNLYIVYDRERDNRRRLDRETWTSEAAKEILLCRVRREDVMSGALSENSFIARVISKGGMDTVEY
jgi:hypothetical protein